MGLVRAVGGVLVALLASPALAQRSSGTWNGLTDRFGIDAGYFGLTAQNVLTFKGGNVDFERDLGLDDAVDTFWVDATWRVGRRHQLKLSLTRFSRERADFALERDFVWGGETYNAGLSATSTSGSDILGGYYRLHLRRRRRRAGRRGHLQGLPDLPVVPVLIRTKQPDLDRRSGSRGRSNDDE